MLLDLRSQCVLFWQETMGQPEVERLQVVVQDALAISRQLSDLCIGVHLYEHIQVLSWVLS